MSKTPVIKSTITESQLNFSEKNNIFDIIQNQLGTNSKSVISISWGPDSMLTAVLIYNFYCSNKYNLQNLIFVHFNHKLRKESDQEEQFLKKYFKWAKLVCISKTWVKTSNELTLRNRRYSEIQKVINKTKTKYVFLGHNLSDRIESSFMNLLRWASLKWFISMNKIQQHNLLKWVKVIRPLLSLWKNYIAQVCKKNNIPFVVDQSNFDSSVSLRNKLRNEVLPSIYNLSNSKSWQSTFESSMLNIYTAIEKLNSEEEKNTNNSLKDILTSSHWKSKFAYQRNIKLQDITTESIVNILNQLWLYKNISSPLLEELQKFFKNSKDWHKYFNKTYFFIAHNKIYIISATKNFWKKTVKNAIKMWNKETQFWDFNIRPEKILEWATIRYPKSWDRFRNKTFSQYCINQKIPIFRRNYLPVLEKNNKIIKIIKPQT